MVTGELKSKIDALWEIFWTGGITNPLAVIEQMTYLMFIFPTSSEGFMRWSRSKTARGRNRVSSCLRRKYGRMGMICP